MRVAMTEMTNHRAEVEAVAKATKVSDQLLAKERERAPHVERVKQQKD